MLTELLKNVLSNLKNGTKPEIQWEFLVEDFFDNSSGEDGYMECYPTIHANIVMGDKEINMFRTFNANVYHEDGNLVTVTFNELENRQWELFHSDYESKDLEIFKQIIAQIEMDYSKLLLPDYADMEEDERSNLQDELDALSTSEHD